MSFTNCLYPLQWKRAKLIPLQKNKKLQFSGEKAVQSAFYLHEVKIMERVIFEQIIKHSIYSTWPQFVEKPWRLWVWVFLTVFSENWSNWQNSVFFNGCVSQENAMWGTTGKLLGTFTVHCLVCVWWIFLFPLFPWLGVKSLFLLDPKKNSNNKSHR